MADPLAIRTLIVDDEALARDGVRYHLENDPDFVILEEISRGDLAIRVIGELHPDLVFLDVQMPGIGGFDVLKAIPSESLPIVVFVTAYDHYAVPAFDANALDYVLKPIDTVRFATTRERVKTIFRDRRQVEIANRLASILDQLHALPAAGARAAEPIRRFAITERDTISFVTADEIDWIEAADYYVKLHAGKKTHLLRETLAHIEQQLDSTKFIRVHRSTIVRIDRIKELRRHFDSGYTVILVDGTKLKLSRNYRPALLMLLGKAE